jgi:hypothetical protein
MVMKELVVGLAMALVAAIAVPTLSQPSGEHEASPSVDRGVHDVVMRRPPIGNDG